MNNNSKEVEIWNRSSFIYVFT